MTMGTRRLTLDDIDITVLNITFAGPELANSLCHGGPLEIAKRLVEIAEGADAVTRAALIDLAHQIEPGPRPQVLATRCRITINLQPDHTAPADDDPAPNVWGPEMADYVAERWLRGQLDNLTRDS
jgi:hypothetical protein